MKLLMALDSKVLEDTLKRITNSVYHLLCNREDGVDWEKPLETLLVELVGMRDITHQFEEPLFILICKLEGLFYLTSNDDFFLFRRTIFECLNILNSMVNKLCHT